MAIAMATISQVSNFYADPVQKSQMSHFAASLPPGQIGHIERTLFMLDWFRDPALRRRVQAGLNKGEARNALARAVFMHRLGEIRDRKPGNQSYRASGLTLLTAAISLWNTVYMERAVDALKRKD